MGFFFNPAKTDAVDKKADKPKAVRRDDIPVTSLRSLGCTVCPRNTDKTLKHPKLGGQGAARPDVYILRNEVTEMDDQNGKFFVGNFGKELKSKLGKDFFSDRVRGGTVTQCHGPQTHIEIECCRNRVIADIEKSKPKIILGIGDGPLAWATGIQASTLTHRGSMFPVKIGRHTCFYFPVPYPNYLSKKSYQTSPQELLMEQDIGFMMDWLKRDPTPKVHEAPVDGGVELITGQEPGDMQRLEKALEELALEPKSAVDIETNCLRPYFNKDPHIWTAAVGTFKRTIAFSVDHPEGWGTKARQERVRGLLGHYLLASGRKAAHNLSFELEWFTFFFGKDVLRRTEWDDTQAIAHTLDERPGTKSLGHQTLLMFGFDIKKQSMIDVVNLLDYPLKDVLRYNGMDTKWTDKLRDARMPDILANKKYEDEYLRKVRLAPTLVLTETKGLTVDFDYAKKQDEILRAGLERIEAQIAKCAEVKKYTSLFRTFEPTNPKHVLKLLKDVCDRDEVRVVDDRTGAVTWTTGEDVIALIPASEVPSVPLILEHRGMAKLRSTYVGPILSRKIVCPDGKVRPKYGSMHAVTGRLNAEDPNVQNWPARKNKEIRGIICSDSGDIMAACDYGQIEFRVVGMASHDPAIVEACWTGYDVHKFWAERAVAIYPKIKDWIVDEFKIDWDEKGIKTLRQEMKNKWVFPQLFGSAINSCAANLHLPDATAAKLGNEFWDTFKVTKKWQDTLLIQYEKNLYVETLGGRRRRGAMTKNEVINTPIQGTAADIVTTAMCAISEMSYDREDEELNPALNVHDDLTYLISEANLESKVKTIATEMCRHRFDYINVPLVVEVKVGYQWHALEEIKVYRSNELFNLRNPYV